jgi:hypothetical protein
VAEVGCLIIIYPSVADAKADFIDLVENGDLTLTEVSGHFEQCQMWSIDYGFVGNFKMFSFQEKNVCGIISFSITGSSDLSQEWIDEMLTLQESRIV